MRSMIPPQSGPEMMGPPAPPVSLAQAMPKPRPTRAPAMVPQSSPPGPFDAAMAAGHGAPQHAPSPFDAAMAEGHGGVATAAEKAAAGGGGMPKFDMQGFAGALGEHNKAQGAAQQKAPQEAGPSLMDVLSKTRALMGQ